MNSKRNKVIACVILFATLGVFGSYAVASAQIGVYPFGGKVLFGFPCTCNFGWYVVIGLPRPGAFVFQPPFSQLKMWWNLFTPGVWTLGTATTTGAFCGVGIPPFCAPVPAFGYIIKVGTGLFPTPW